MEYTSIYGNSFYGLNDENKESARINESNYSYSPSNLFALLAPDTIKFLLSIPLQLKDLLNCRLACKFFAEKIDANVLVTRINRIDQIMKIFKRAKQVNETNSNDFPFF